RPVFLLSHPSSKSAKQELRVCCTFPPEEGAVNNADYRGGVTCLYDTQLLGACLHASESGGRSRPEAVRGMPGVPIAPPATGPPEGWAAFGFVGPACFGGGLWARLLRVLGSLPLILGSEGVRIWVLDRFSAWLGPSRIGLSIATSLSYQSD